MDNLEQLWCHPIKIKQEEFGKCISCSSSEQLACFITDSNYVCIYEHSNPERPIVKEFQDKELKYIHYLAVHDAVFLGTDYELIIYDRHTLQYNVCYKLEKKIVALEWNPAETAVIIIDEDNKLFLFNYSTLHFECLHNNDLSAECPGSVYVGWGSQNTQFQGPKSRQKTKEKVSLIELKYNPPKLSWRGNGELVAINFYKNGQRFVKVFDSQLKPLNESAEYPNLIEPIAFMVAGQCIACTSVGDVNTVVIFEKNCKVKSTFEVPENKGRIRKMLYHPQMNILAVYSLDEGDCGYLNIYLYANGIWLLKQQLYFPPNRMLQHFQWINLHEPLNTICRLVIFTTQFIEYYTFRFIINKCPGASLVAVIDGKNITLYDYTQKILPPPMADCVVTHSRPVNRILFHPKKLFCVLVDSQLQVVVISLKDFSKVLTSEILDLKYVPSFRSIIWNDENKIQVNIDSVNKFETFEGNNLTLTVKSTDRDKSQFALPYNDTDCLVSHKDLCVKTGTLIYLTKKVLSVNNSEITLDIALSSNRELYSNDQVVCNGVTSVFIFQDYLLLTTVGCRLYCVRLLQSYNGLLNGKLDLERNYSREIEQGARIVSVSSTYPPQIVMILPRGNLEVIRCRLLTIDIIEKLLSENDWKTAVDIMRTERMDWNLLIDLNSKRFSSHIKDFVKAAEFSTNLNMIVNNFSNKTTFYKNCLQNFQITECNKTELVKQIVNYLISTDIINNLLSIVAIQEKHFSLKSALNYIKIVFELNPASNESVCKKALQYLINKGYFKDILDATYALYSLDFLSFVYQNSSEDPKIYAPEIVSFSSLEPIELRFKMSLKANNPKEAVKYLLRCSNYDTAFVESFILKHKLETVAYKCLPPMYKHFVTVSRLYAKHLSLKHKHSEAAFVFKQANLIPQALEQYSEALDWREVLSILTVHKYDIDEQKKVLYDLSNKLSRAHKVDEAVLLLDKYNDDYKKAIQLFVEHKAFRKAVCLAKERNAVEMLEELVIPNLKSFMLDLKDRIDEYETTFKKYFNRLHLLREEKRIKLDNAALGVYEGGDDLYSDTGSTLSSYGSSRATSKSRSSLFSSKSRRKEARKKVDLREGGYYEDIALIRALHIMYSDVFSLGKDVREICLISNNDLELAKALHLNLSRVQDMMKNHVSLIWLDVFVNVPQDVDNAVLAVIENRADLDPMYCVPPSEELLCNDWKLEIYLQ